MEREVRKKVAWHCAGLWSEQVIQCLPITLFTKLGRDIPDPVPGPWCRVGKSSLKWLSCRDRELGEKLQIPYAVAIGIKTLEKRTEGWAGGKLLRS